MQEFLGKVALVTGGTSGIGKATVLQLARAGTHVVFTGRRAAEGKQVADEAQNAGARYGVRSVFIQGDVTDESHIKQAVEAAASINGRLNFALNNAGLENVGVPTVEATAEEYKRVFDVNVLGVLLSMKHEIRAMLRSTDAGGGSIVNVTSVASVIGMPSAGIYIASKHAVTGLTKSAALEVAKQNIRINAVAPAAIETPMLDRFTGNRSPDAVNWLTGLHPIGRLGKTDEIASPVMFLFSNAASFITGSNMMVDGGFTAQ